MARDRLSRLEDEEWHWRTAQLSLELELLSDSVKAFQTPFSTITTGYCFLQLT